MLLDAGLVLEGGGTRCVFTAGILDYFMEKDVYFKHVYALSASAYVGLNYISKQPHRTKDTMIDKVSSRMFSWRSLFTTGDIYNTKMLFDDLPNGTEMPFDYDTFFNSESKLTMSVTSLLTGKQVYMDRFDGPADLMAKCRASNCFPMLTKIQYIDGEPVLDGGMADPIPINKAIEDGVKKNVVLLTQMHGFRKKIAKSRLISMRYHKYPEFVKIVNARPAMYNEELENIDRLAQNGDILAFYPSQQPPALITRKKALLQSFYDHGYEYAKQILPEIIAFVNGEK